MVGNAGNAPVATSSIIKGNAFTERLLGHRPRTKWHGVLVLPQFSKVLETSPRPDGLRMNWWTAPALHRLYQARPDFLRDLACCWNTLAAQIGGDDRNRTRNLVLAKHLLY